MVNDGGSGEVRQRRRWRGATALSATAAAASGGGASGGVWRGRSAVPTRGEGWQHSREEREGRRLYRRGGGRGACGRGRQRRRRGGAERDSAACGGGSCARGRGGRRAGPAGLRPNWPGLVEKVFFLNTDKQK